MKKLNTYMVSFSMQYTEELYVKAATSSEAKQKAFAQLKRTLKRKDFNVEVEKQTDF